MWGRPQPRTGPRTHIRHERRCRTAGRFHQVPRQEAHVRGDGDDDLVERAAGGDVDAFTTLARRHRRLIDAACATVCANREDREDAVQQALVDIWRGLSGFSGDSKLTTWMFRVAQNAAHRHVRKAMRVVPTADGADAADLSSPKSEWNDAVVTRSALLDALAGLPADQRDALLLHTQCGMPLQEIADLKYAALGTVKTRIHRARAEIARALDEADR